MDKIDYLWASISRIMEYFMFRNSFENRVLSLTVLFQFGVASNHDDSFSILKKKFQAWIFFE